MSFEKKNVDGIDFVKVDGEWIKEINIAEMEQKLRDNIALLKNYDSNILKTEEEINNCISRQLSYERITLYYKAQAMQQKRERSRAEVRELGLVRPDEFFGRYYALSRQFGTADKPDTKELNKETDKWIFDYSEKGNEARRKYFISYINTVNSLDFSKINYMKSTVSFNDAIKYAIDHYPEMYAGFIMHNYLGNHTAYGFAHNKVLDSQINRIKGKGEAVGGIGVGLFNYACEEIFLTVPFDQISSEVLTKMRVDIKNQAKVAPVFLGNVFNLKNEIELSSEFEETVPHEYTEYDFTDISLSLDEYKRKLCDYYVQLNAFEGDITESKPYKDLLTAIKDALIFIGNQNSVIDKVQYTKFKETVKNLGLTTSSASMLRKPSEEKLKNLAQGMRGDLESMIRCGFGFDAAVEKWNQTFSPEKASILGVFETSAKKQFNETEYEGFIANNSIVNWKKNLASNSFDCVGSNTAALQSIKYLQDSIEAAGVDSDIEQFYNSLKSAITALDGENINNKETWETQLSDLESKARAYINAAKTKMAGSEINQLSATRYEIAASMLKIGQKYRNINPALSPGNLRRIRKNEMIGLLNNIEADLKQIPPNASHEYFNILDGIRLARRLTENVEKQKDFESALKVLFDSSMSFLVQNADKKLDTQEKLLLDKFVRAAMLSRYPLSEHKNPSQKEIDRWIVYSKFAKHDLSLFDKSILPQHANSAKNIRTSPTKFYDFISGISSNPCKKFVDSLSDQELAEYSMRDAADVVEKYKEIYPDTEFANEYIERLKSVVSRQIRMYDRNNYDSDDLRKYAESTELPLSVTRTAVSALAMCLFIKDGYDVQDVLGSEKLADIKKIYGQKAAQLIKDNKTLEVAEAYRFGCEKICDYVDKLLFESHPLTPDFITSDKGIQLSLFAIISNDISQEMGRLRTNVQKEIAKLKDNNPGFVDNLTESYEEITSRGADPSIILGKLGVMFKDFREYVSDLYPDVHKKRILVQHTFTMLKRINTCISDIKSEMQQTGKDYHFIVREIKPGETVNKYAAELASLTGLTDDVPGLRDKLSKKVEDDPQLVSKMIKAFFEGKYENVTVEGNAKEIHLSGLETLVNELIDKKFREEIIKDDFVYKANEEGIMVKGRFVDGQFVPAKVEKYGVVLDTIYRDDLRADLENNIKIIKEYCPDFEMSEEEINDQLSDDNIEKTYRALALQMKIKNNTQKVRVPVLTSPFFKRVNQTFIQVHGEDKSASLMAGGIAGDEARKKLIADTYNRVIDLDADVFDFHNSFKNKENEGKDIDLTLNQDLRFDVDKEKYDKAFDYAIEHYEDLEYGMVVESAAQTGMFGFELNPKLKPELVDINSKGSVLGGIARLIRDNHANMNTLVMPVNKLTSRQLDTVIAGLAAKPQKNDAENKKISQFSDVQLYFRNGLHNATYLEKPGNHHYSMDDFKTRRLPLQGIKESIENIHEKLKFANDGSDIYAIPEYSDLISKQENLLRMLAEVGDTIDPQMKERLIGGVIETRQAFFNFEGKSSKASDDVKLNLRPIFEQYHDQLMSFSFDAQNMGESIDSWNERDGKSLENFVKMKIRRDRDFGTDAVSLKSESVLSAMGLVTWERVTSEKNFKSVNTISQALAAIKHLASGLDTTKRDHDEFRNLKTVLQTAIANIENAEPANRIQVLNEALESIGIAAKQYIIAKPDRLKNYGLSERSERRFEKAHDLCMLVGTLKHKELRNDPLAEPSPYKAGVMNILNEYSAAMNLASVSGDSVEYKRLKEKMAYVRSMVSASDSADFIQTQLKELASEGLDYYIKKIGEPIRGTRGQKLDLIRQLRQLALDCKSNPIPHPSKDMDSQDYQFNIAAKMVKEMYRKKVKNGNKSQKLEAKQGLSDSKAFMAKVTEIMNTPGFAAAFGRMTKEQLRKAAEKKGTDLNKFYVSKIPKMPADRPVDAYIKRISDFLGSLNSTLSIDQYHTKKEGLLFKNKNLPYTTERTMLRTFAVCELLNKGYSLADILDSNKFKKEKKYFAQKGMRLVTRAEKVGDDAALEISSTLLRGGQKLVDCLNDLYSKVDDLSDKNLLTENGKLILAVSSIIKDVIQEAPKGIDKNDETNELVTEIKALLNTADTLNKFGAASIQYLEAIVNCSSKSKMSVYSKPAAMMGAFISQKHLNKALRELKSNPENAGKTMAEMLAVKPEQPESDSKVYEVMTIMGAVAGSGSEILSNLENDLVRDPLLCDKYIEANANGVFEAIDIPYDPATMEISLDVLAPVMANIKNGAMQKQDRIMDGIQNPQRNVPNPVSSENHNKPVDAQKLLQRELSGSKQLQAEKPKAEKSHDKIIIEDEPILK